MQEINFWQHIKISEIKLEKYILWRCLNDFRETIFCL